MPVGASILEKKWTAVVRLQKKVNLVAFQRVIPRHTRRCSRHLMEGVIAVRPICRLVHIYIVRSSLYPSMHLRGPIPTSFVWIRS